MTTTNLAPVDSKDFLKDGKERQNPFLDDEIIVGYDLRMSINK